MTDLKYILKFKPHVLNKEEEYYSVVFEDIQVKGLENQLISIANEKLAMPVPSVMGSTEDYIRKQEYLRGQMDILQYILAVSDTVKKQKIEQE